MVTLSAQTTTFYSCILPCKLTQYAIVNDMIVAVGYLLRRVHVLCAMPQCRQYHTTLQYLTYQRALYLSPQATLADALYTSYLYQGIPSLRYLEKSGFYHHDLDSTSILK